MGIVLSLKHLERHALYKYALAGFLLGTLFYAIPQLKWSVKRFAPIRNMILGKSIGTDSNVSAFLQYSMLRPYIGSTDVVMAPLMESWELPEISPSAREQRRS